MKLGRFTLGYVAMTTLAAAAGFIVLNYFAKRYPGTPIVGPLVRALP